MPNERDVIVEVLKWLWDKHGRPWLNTSDQNFKVLFERLQRAFRPISDGSHLEKLLAKNMISEKSPGGAVFYLRPITRSDWLLPILAGEFDFAGEYPVVRFRLALFALDASKNAVGFGFRYETPESPDRSGRHGYYHVQPITTFAGVPLPQLPTWIAESTPACPLDAKDSVMLLLCTLASVYGVEMIDKMQRDLGGLPKAYVDNLWMHQHRPRYLRAKLANRTFFCWSRKDANEFRKVVQQTFKGATLEPCSEDEYLDAIAADQRSF